MKAGFWNLVLVLACCSAVFGVERVSYVDVVNRLVDLERLAETPAEGERCAQFSGYDRSSRYDAATGEYVNWDANLDWTGYVRKEKENFVLGEIEGPGVIWRIWSARTGEGRVKIYLDGGEEAVIDMPFAKFFDRSTKPFTRRQLCYETEAMGFNCYVPISFEKSCKIVADSNWPYVVLPDQEKGVFYHFTYSQFPKGTRVETFKMDLEEDGRKALDRVDGMLSRAGERPVGKKKGEITEEKTVTIKAGETEEIFNVEGEYAITSFVIEPEFQVEAGNYRTLREVTVSMYWDDMLMAAVWSPLGDFFGTAPGENLYKPLPMGMTEKGYYSYWYMPFSKRGRIELRNEGAEAYTFRAKVTYSKLDKPKEKFARFHAKWHRDAFLPKEAGRGIDWTLLKTQCKGRYCGATLHVWNPKGGWWGEGDEKIFVDGEKFPSTFGTGSEDYFGYAWCVPNLFSRGFHNQTHSNQDPNKPMDPFEGNRGHVSVNRWHVADNVPFQKSIEVCIEKYQGNDYPTLYAAVVYWYQQAKMADLYEAVELGERVGYWEE